MMLKKNAMLFALFMLLVALWNVPVPHGMEPKAWHLLSIFIATILGIILNPLPMGGISMLAILICVLTKTLTIEESLSGFSTEIVWLVLFAFFISNGFIKTGLGERIAYYFISKLGKSTLGLSYGLVISEFILSPFIPSVVARGGGIIFPIAKSVCNSYSASLPHKNRTSGFIMLVCTQSNVITSVLFLTAMAANPLVIKLSADLGVNISWLDWAQAAIVPGLISLFLMPVITYFLYKPEITYSDTAQKLARQNLKALGAITANELIMLITFVTLIGFWILGGSIGISATTTALIGFCILLLFNIIKIDDVTGDKSAWHTFSWFATLVMLSAFLAKFGVMSWIGKEINTLLIGQNPIVAIVLLVLAYFYVHYFFASITTHITVLLPTFLLVLINLGIPPKMAALGLGFLSILSGGITHYGISSAPIYYGEGYVSTKTWWYVGGVISIINLVIWSTIGIVWWKVINLW
jgi:DASS family divalent anion:Na+ symporter